MPPVINIFDKPDENIIFSSSYKYIIRKNFPFVEFRFLLKNVIPINKKCS